MKESHSTIERETHIVNKLKQIISIIYLKKVNLCLDAVIEFVLFNFLYSLSEIKLFFKRQVSLSPELSLSLTHSQSPLCFVYLFVGIFCKFISIVRMFQLKFISFVFGFSSSCRQQSISSPGRTDVLISMPIGGYMIYGNRCEPAYMYALE